MKKQNIEDIFSSMENFSSAPPPELWANIEKKLDKPKKKKRAILWWSAAACLLLGLSLPSVLHFTSNSGTKIINGNSIENNGVVLDENKNNPNIEKSVATEENNSGKESNKVQNSSLKNTENQSANTSNQTEETAAANADSPNKINSDVLNPKSNAGKRITNQAVAEQTTVSEKENQSNSFSKNQKANAAVKNTKQAVAQETIISEKKNQSNSAIRNQNLNTAAKNTNQAVATNIFTSGKQNSFNAASKNQLLDTEKKNADKVLAEKTFTAGKTKTFNTPSKNQTPVSIFEDKLNANSNNVAFSSSNPALNSKQNDETENKKIISRELIKTEKPVAATTPKSNSKFGDVLNKQDSVQLAELQNLEKGIAAAPEVKKGKDKDLKTSSNAEKWAVEVFAGIANSENYKNDKTLGNTNDSKQSNTYGVKTKYKINKKWAVGSGFKINELGQSVANISYISTKNNAFLGTSDYFVQNSTVPQIATNSGYVLVSNSTKNALKSDNLQSGNLDQSLRYIEMPLEVSYAIFSKNRASINLNTGGFVGKLISNNVALDGNSIGENVNANDFVYGSTLSSTLQYRIYKKTNIFVEPAMNYYINPLNSQSFNQFQWGLNFGLNVSF
jgi:hypothetical protein